MSRARLRSPTRIRALALSAASDPNQSLTQQHSRSRSRFFAAADVDIHSQSATVNIAAEPTFEGQNLARSVPSFPELLRSTPSLFPASHVAVNTDALMDDSPTSLLPPATGWCRCGRWPAIVLVGTMWAVMGVALMLAMGKQNLHWAGLLNAQHYLSGLHELPGGAAGTLGVVYPTAQLAPLMHFVADQLTGRQQMARLGIDDLVNLFARQAALRQFHLSPDLVQHVGAFSSSAAKNQGYFDSMKTSPSFVS